MYVVVGCMLGAVEVPLVLFVVVVLINSVGHNAHIATLVLTLFLLLLLL